MVDIPKLIEIILSDPRLAKSSNLASKVYRDEPILTTAEQLQNHTPPKYREMRKLAKSGSTDYESAAKIFYEQGKFMEDFEDDFNYREEFGRYFPTYQLMNDRELRGYFSWRTRVRRNIIEKTSLSFVFVYIYELINQIGVSSPEEGFYKLKNFWMAYKVIDSKISRYVKLWLKDYVIYNNLNKSLLEGFSDTSLDNAISTLLNYRSHRVDEVFKALNSLSSYNLENSRFFKQYPDEMLNVVYDVFCVYSDYFDQHCKKTLCEKLIGKIFTASYYMFNSAVFYPRIHHKNFIYEINNIHKYTCKNDNWSCERFFPYSGKNQQIGVLLKTIDYIFRQRYHFKSTLSAEKTTKVLQTMINNAIDKYRENRKKIAQSTIEIDVSKLQNIRDTALETQRKLIVENLDEAQTTGIIAKQAEPENDIGLSKTEYLLMKLLLYGKTYSDFIQAKGLMLSILVDAINEKLFDKFGDTVITDVEGKPELVTAYIDELKKMIKE